ncbi:hypothetical protein [Microbacterium paraoxydans]|uniref:hypothetical protein n=1 Tax=Microbacterium paraoxydans TaxID=199592 RepID=UPI001CFA128B|nr:hypothetical protein [Microbacterium paraoxydans]
MNARQLRLVRAAAVSSIATLIAGVSHTLGGGTAPHPLLILAVATLLTPLSALLVGARPSRGRVAAAVLLAQAVFHVLFQALGSPVAASSPGVLGHVHHIDLALLVSAPSASSSGAPMLAAHVVAAVLTTLLIWHGETVVRAVARWFEALLRHTVTAAPTDHRMPPGLRSLDHPVLEVAFAAAVTRRGPPALTSG